MGLSLLSLSVVLGCWMYPCEIVPGSGLLGFSPCRICPYAFAPGSGVLDLSLWVCERFWALGFVPVGLSVALGSVPVGLSEALGCWVFVPVGLSEVLGC